MNPQKLTLIGKNHQVCQDYASVGTPDYPYLIISDGCSSSPDTDFGSRLLVKNAEALLSSGISPYRNQSGFVSNVAYSALQNSRALFLQDSCIDATLGVVNKVTDDVFCTVLYGDGVIVKKYKDSNALHFTEVSYRKNFPIYPSYSVRKELKEGLSKLVGNEKIVSSYFINKDDTNLYGQEELILDNNSPETTHSVNVLNLDFIAICTDGVLSFSKKLGNGTTVPMFDSPENKAKVLYELFNFKSIAGKFLERRWFNGFVPFMNKTFGEGSWNHVDDLTIACLVF